MSEKKIAMIGHKWWIILPLLITYHLSLVTSLILISSCSQDAYDKGEGKYSLMRADFAEAHANASRQIDWLVTDDGERLTVLEPYTAKWITTPDSLYRMAVYYMVEQQGDQTVVRRCLTCGRVPCLLPTTDRRLPSDPVRFESAWKSKTGRYLNLSLYLMTGTADDTDATQTLALLNDTLTVGPTGIRTLHLRLLHDQGGIPEYYSSQVYLSIPTEPLRADSIHADSAIITIPTYQGEVTKSFAL